MAIGRLPIGGSGPILGGLFSRGSALMKQFFAAVTCWAGLGSGAFAADVGVSIQFSQPGVFGRVDIGQFPQPQVIVTQPVIVAPAPPAMAPAEPIYLWVPMEHRKHWERYCG